jgi:hypothetical protein
VEKITIMCLTTAEYAVRKVGNKCECISYEIMKKVINASTFIEVPELCVVIQILKLEAKKMYSNIIMKNV